MQVAEVAAAPLGDGSAKVDDSSGNVAFFFFGDQDVSVD